MNNEDLKALVTVHGSAQEGAMAAALEIADLIERKPEAVLGLATGGTMVDVYAGLVGEAKRRTLDTSRVRTFNLDEYLGFLPGDPHLFRSFMDRHLFGPLGFHPGQGLFPDDQLAVTDPVTAARSYEDAIVAAGGIDLQLLGIGRNGHIAFNEPGSAPESRTRVVELHKVTRASAAGDFGGVELTPQRAITMGISTILEARALRLLAFGEAKAEVVRQMLQSVEDSAAPCTFLPRRHGDFSVHLDPEAAQLLGAEGA